MHLRLVPKWVHVCLAISLFTSLTKGYAAKTNQQKNLHNVDYRRTITGKPSSILGDSNDLHFPNARKAISYFARLKRSSNVKSTTEIVIGSKKDKDSLYTNVPLSKKQEIFEEIDEPILPHIYHDDDDESPSLNENNKRINNDFDDYSHVEDVDKAVSDELNSIFSDDTGLERRVNDDYTRTPTPTPTNPTRSTVANKPSSNQSIVDDLELAIDENAEHNKDVTKEAAQTSIERGNQQELHKHDHAQSLFNQQQQQEAELQKERQLEKEKQALDFEHLLNGDTNVVVKDDDKEFEKDDQQNVYSSATSNSGQYITNAFGEQDFPLTSSQGVTETINDSPQGVSTVSLDTNRTKGTDDAPSSGSTGTPIMTMKSVKSKLVTKGAHNTPSSQTKLNDTHNPIEDLKGTIDSNDDHESRGKPKDQHPSSSFINEHPIAFKILMEYFQNETHLQEQLQNKLKSIKVEGNTAKKSDGLHRKPLPLREFISKLLKLAKKYEKKVMENAQKGTKKLDAVTTQKHYKKKFNEKNIKMQEKLQQVNGSRKDGVIPTTDETISVNKTIGVLTPVAAPQKDQEKTAYTAQTTMSPLEIDKALQAMEIRINKILAQREKHEKSSPLTTQKQLTANYFNPPSTQQINQPLTQQINQPLAQQSTQPFTQQVGQPSPQQMASLNPQYTPQMAVNELNQAATLQMVQNGLYYQPVTHQVTLNTQNQPVIHSSPQMVLNTQKQQAQLNLTLNQHVQSTQTSSNDLYKNRLESLQRSLSQDFFKFWMYHFRSFEEMSINPNQLRSGIASLGSTARLGRVVRKALQGQTINLLIVGGSISAGGGLERDRHDVHGIYFKALEEWWKTVVQPITGAHLQMDVVAIGGTDSEYFSYCIKNYVHERPDLVLWELAANDYRRYLGRDMDPAKPLEQLTRVLLTLPSHPAIIFVNFFRGDYYKTTIGQNCPDSEDEGGRLIAEYYKITSLSWRNVICSQMKQEPVFPDLAFKREFSPLTLQTLFSSDGYHPSLLGHAQCASLLISYIRSVFEEVVSQEVTKTTTGTPYNDMNEHFVLPRPIYDDPSSPSPLCWTLLTPNYNLNIPNQLPNMKIVQANGFVLTNITRWPVRTDRLRCLKALYPGASLVVSFFAPTTIQDVTKPVRQMVLITHNSFTGSANVWLDNNAANPMFINEPAGQRRTQINIVSRDLSPGGHVVTIYVVQPGFCVSGLAIL